MEHQEELPQDLVYECMPRLGSSAGVLSRAGAGAGGRFLCGGISGLGTVRKLWNRSLSGLRTEIGCLMIDWCSL